MRIVSLAPYMPYEGIPHAGGDLYRRHLELLSRMHDVVVMCPATPENERALTRPEPVGFERLLVPLRHRRLSALGLGKRIAPFLPGAVFGHGLLEDADAVSRLSEADAVELQWFQCATLAPRLRRRFPRPLYVGVFHDVVSQGLLRRVRAPELEVRRRSVSLVRLLLAATLERRTLDALDVAVVLSDKDAALLRRRGARATVRVLPPVLEEDPGSDIVEPTGPRSQNEVLFVGAFWRPENDDAARWLIEQIWPVVRAAVPEARLTLAGAEPSAALRRAADLADGVRVTGYLPSLRPCYLGAAVAVAPMRLGAGVKLKTVVAMLAGVPVVSTPVGAEGLEGEGIFVGVEAEAGAFAKAVVTALTDPERAAAVAKRARAWSSERFSQESYRQRLRQIYP